MSTHFLQEFKKSGFKDGLNKTNLKLWFKEKKSQILPLFPDYFQILLEIESLQDLLQSHWSDYSPTIILPV